MAWSSSTLITTNNLLELKNYCDNLDTNTCWTHNVTYKSTQYTTHRTTHYSNYCSTYDSGLWSSVYGTNNSGHYSTNNSSHYSLRNSSNCTPYINTSNTTHRSNN